MIPSRLRARPDFSERTTWLAMLATALIGIAVGAVAFPASPTDASPAHGTPPSIGGVTQAPPGSVTRGRGLRVLFIGNSLTFVNDLGQLVAGFAAHMPGHEPVLAYTWAIAGASLGQDQAAPGFAKVLAATRWDVVVLQEDTALGSIVGAYPTGMSADVARIAAQVRAVGAVPILFETWGNRTGTDPYPYATEQGWIANNYRLIGSAQHVPIAHVGDAWALALDTRPALALWGPDGHHPSPIGSYLAAAVISACVDHARRPSDSIPDPKLSSYTAGLDPALARWLHRLASQSINRVGCSA